MESNYKHQDVVGSWFTFFHLLVVVHTLHSCSSVCSGRDTISHNDWIQDDGETLVSTGGRFELGFFTLSNDGEKKYVGVWYHKFNPKTFVWVANREKPLLNNSNGVFGTKDGNLKLIDTNGSTTYWSTDLEMSPESSNLTVKLMDSGNLVLYENSTDQRGEYLWQSFEHPTDTFLPHMKMDKTKSFNLSSWRDRDDPRIGNFTFKVDEEGEDQFIITKKSSPYWKSRDSGMITDKIKFLLTNFSTEAKPTNSTVYSNITRPFNQSDYDNARLVINFTGQIQYLKWDEEAKAWPVQWSEPKDRCSVYNACGNFGICNVDERKACKCLPGFEPTFPEKWSNGDFLGGCTRRTKLCGKDGKDGFLVLKMVKVGLESSILNDKNETECRAECLDNCLCSAYSFDKSSNNRRGVTGVSNPCRIWNGEDLGNLQEGYGNGGYNIFVRIALFDLEPSVRSCEPCGAIIIPYPLSTGPDCGDPIYSNFHCDTSTGQVRFQVPDSNYRVISMDAEKRTFIVDTKQPQSPIDKCNVAFLRGTILHLNQFLPFIYKVTTWCYAEPEPKPVDYISQVPPIGRTIEVEISWNPPILEPICTSSTDCARLPNSTCITPKDGRRRCLCDANLRWNSYTLNCTQEGGEVNKPVLEAEPSKPRKEPSMWIIVPLTVFGIVLLSSIVVFVIIRRRKVTKKEENRKADKKSRTLHALDSQKHIKDLIESGNLMGEDEQRGIDVPFFDLESILEATDGFSAQNKLGQGGYGPVYKGVFPGGEEIAVKRLSSVSGQGLQELKNEVVLIAKLQHRNLVRLKGFCIKGDEKILIYEYMPNRSLDSFIFDQMRSALLNWEARFNIIMGIARGLVYLHQDSRLRIIHRDLKTSNILLDKEMNAKISDFGLARIFGGKQTEANTSRVIGTYGYMSPEYALDGFFSIKSDVFSFGVVLLEVLSGKKNTGFYQSDKPLNLLGYAWRFWTENKVLDFMDQTLHESCKQDQFVRCVNVGLLCVQDDPNDRPTMSNVITMLDSESASLIAKPKEPAFVLRRGFSSVASSSVPEISTEATISLQEDRLV